MTCNNLMMGKGAVVTLLCCTIQPSENLSKKHPNMDREQMFKNSIVLCCKMNKIRKKEAGCIIFTHQDFRDCDALIELYTIEIWCQITSEVDRHLLLSYGTLEERK